MEIIEKIEELRSLLKKQEQEIETLKIEASQINIADEFDTLKILLESSKWPSAVAPSLICDISSEQDKQDRAEGILDVIVDVHLENLAFLDFGCGSGHVNNRSLTQNPRVSVGYDIKKHDNWDEWPDNEKTLYTTDWEKVKSKGPYNIVLIYDVIDHMDSEEEVIDNLKKIKEVMAPKAKIYIRTHPWCSRHGTHLYHKINKAFIHLVFNDKELEKLGYKNEPLLKTIHPLKTYDYWFKTAGFNILHMQQNTHIEVEPFFRDTPLVAKRIKSHWIHSHEEDLRTGRRLPEFQMKFQFIDYILS